MRKLYLFLIISISILLTGCGGDEPISENELKTNELRSKYADKIVGSWWQERIDENDKAFEQLNLSAEGTLTGYIKWLHRKKVMVGGEEVWTDWETEEEGKYCGNWNLFWKDGQSYINILAKVEGSNYYWYSTDMVFNGIFQDEDTEWLDIVSPFWKGKDNESTVYYIYQRGSSSPSF